MLLWLYSYDKKINVMSFQKTLDRYQKRDIIIINKEQRTGDIKNGRLQNENHSRLHEI